MLSLGGVLCDMNAYVSLPAVFRHFDVSIILSITERAWTSLVAYLNVSREDCCIGRDGISTRLKSPQQGSKTAASVAKGSLVV